MTKILIALAVLCALVALAIDATIIEQWHHPLAWLAASVGLRWTADLT